MHAKGSSDHLKLYGTVKLYLGGSRVPLFHADATDKAMLPATPLPAAAADPAARMLGLQAPAAAPSSAIKSRKAPVKAPERSSSIWKTVRIIREHPTTPNVECLQPELQQDILRGRDADQGAHPHRLQGG